MNLLILLLAEQLSCLSPRCFPSGGPAVGPGVRPLPQPVGQNLEAVACPKSSISHCWPELNGKPSSMKL